MKIQLIRDSKVVNAWNNRVPEVFIKPKERIVVVFHSEDKTFEENKYAEYYQYRGHHCYDLLDHDTGVLECFYDIYIGEEMKDGVEKWNA